MGGITQAMIDAAMLVLEQLFSPIEGLIETYGSALLRAIVGTPHPDRIFGAPANGPWPELHAYYWDTIIPLSLMLYGLSLGLVIFLETTSHLFSGYHTSRLKKRAFVGLLGILSWWWLAGFSLTLVAGIAGVLIPDLSEITLFQSVSFAAIGVLGLVVSLSVDLSLFVLLAVIYLLRQLVLYLYVLLVPLLIALWIPGIGPFALVSQFVKRLAGLYVPFLLMTLPIALLFRLGEILGSSVSLSLGGIGRWLTALVIPILAVLLPFVMVWQAGALFFMLDRAGRQMSNRTRRRRVDSLRSTGGRLRQGIADAHERTPTDRRGIRQALSTVSGTGGQHSGVREVGGGESSSTRTQQEDGSTMEESTQWQSGADLLGKRGGTTEVNEATDQPTESDDEGWREPRLDDLDVPAGRTDADEDDN